MLILHNHTNLPGSVTYPYLKIVHFIVTIELQLLLTSQNSFSHQQSTAV